MCILYRRGQNITAHRLHLLSLFCDVLVRNQSRVLTYTLPSISFMPQCMLCRNFLQDKTFQLGGRLIKTEAVKHPSPQGKLLNFRKSLKLTEYAKCPRSPSLYKQEGLLKDPVRPAQLSGENRDPLNSLEGNSPNC